MLLALRHMSIRPLAPQVPETHQEPRRPSPAALGLTDKLIFWGRGTNLSICELEIARAHRIGESKQTEAELGHQSIRNWFRIQGVRVEPRPRREIQRPELKPRRLCTPTPLALTSPRRPKLKTQGPEP